LRVRQQSEGLETHGLRVERIGRCEGPCK
jgi:hypothetical protein